MSNSRRKWRVPVCGRAASPARFLFVGATVFLAALIFGAGHARAALSPFASETGKISLSVDALGTNDPAGSAISVQKNAGATVRKAYLFTAKIPFTGQPVDGEVTLNGNPITWDPSTFVSSTFGNFTAAADVTSIVKPIVDAAPPGLVNFTAAEGDNTDLYDGEVLAVILDDPTVTHPGSVILLYGTQSTAGDTFNVALSDPVDKTNPNFGLDLGIGISFSYDPGGGSQFSTVDVNGTRMSSSAGGQDDCADAVAGDFSNCPDGTLITAGGIGDLNDNPPNPLATPETGCVGVMGPSPRCDDELYNLLPFVNNGDTTLTFNTTNPSNDDDIFFAALNVHASAAIVGAGIVLGPASATNTVGANHTFTATVQDANGGGVAGVTVTFTANSGPNAGVHGTGVTDANGHATFTYSSTVTGTDTFTASFTDTAGVKHTSNEATKTWVANAGDTTPPLCALSSMIAGPPKQIQVSVQDTGSGLQSIAVTESNNADTVVPPFTVGTTDPVTITSTKIDQSQGSSLALTVTDVAGNVTKCDPIVPGLAHHGALNGVMGRTFSNLLAEESKVTVANGSSALRFFTLRVNGKTFTMKVAGRLSRTINVAPAMHKGNNNKVTVRVKGAKASAAMISISS